ncbi:MAG: PilZ domain-containing protein [Chitinivibrionales bacterium]|nr:PilZ domain-containing protein [Chitinivibrionales bacterium]
MRRYIRHPSDIPIQYKLGDIVANSREYLNNISKGGLSFRSHSYIKKGTAISIEIPLVRPIFSTIGVVVWCTRYGDNYNVGVKFTDSETQFRIRMVEQVCHIESYKHDIERKEGRSLSGEEAAAEWINKYAEDFPVFGS